MESNPVDPDVSGVYGPRIVLEVKSASSHSGEKLQMDVMGELAGEFREDLREFLSAYGLELTAVKLHNPKGLGLEEIPHRFQSQRNTPKSQPKGVWQPKNHPIGDRRLGPSKTTFKR